MKKIVLAIATAPDAIPVNPNIPAMIAIIKNITVHFNITKILIINNQFLKLKSSMCSRF